MKRIIVVDDQPTILDMVQMALEMEGYQVETSQSGVSLWQMQAPFPNLILLDIFLKGEDGRAICRALKLDDQTKHIPVILLSAHMNADGALRESGADAFLAKPFHLNTLSALVRRYTQPPPIPSQ